MPVTHRFKKRRHNQAHALCRDVRCDSKCSNFSSFANCGLCVADARQNGGHQEQHVRLKRRAEPGAQQLDREESMLLRLHGRGFVLHHGLREQRKSGAARRATGHQRRTSNAEMMDHSSKMRAPHADTTAHSPWAMPRLSSSCVARVQRLSVTTHAFKPLYPWPHPLKPRGDDLTTLRFAHGSGGDDTRQRSTKRLLHRVTRCRKPSSEARQQCLKIFGGELAGKRRKQTNDAGFEAILCQVSREDWEATVNSVRRTWSDAAPPGAVQELPFAAAATSDGIDTQRDAGSMRCASWSRKPTSTGRSCAAFAPLDSTAALPFSAARLRTCASMRGVTQGSPPVRPGGRTKTHLGRVVSERANEQALCIQPRARRGGKQAFQKRTGLGGLQQLQSCRGRRARSRGSRLYTRASVRTSECAGCTAVRSYLLRPRGALGLAFGLGRAAHQHARNRLWNELRSAGGARNTPAEPHAVVVTCSSSERGQVAPACAQGGVRHPPGNECSLQNRFLHCLQVPLVAAFRRCLQPSTGHFAAFSLGAIGIHRPSGNCAGLAVSAAAVDSAKVSLQGPGSQPAARLAQSNTSSCRARAPEPT